MINQHSAERSAPLMQQEALMASASYVTGIFNTQKLVVTAELA